MHVTYAQNFHFNNYSQTSNNKRTKLQNLHISRPALYMFTPNPLKRGVKPTMKI